MKTGDTYYYVEQEDFNCYISPVIIEQINTRDCQVNYPDSDMCAFIPHQLLHQTLDAAKTYAIALLNKKIKLLENNKQIIETLT